MKRWNKRFLTSTRGQVVQLLRRGASTVSELAAALNLTDNAIRSHLATLERDGLVRPSGKRPGVRKPETIYALTAEAEHLFPKAYHLLLTLLLDALHDHLPPEIIEDMLRDVGRKIAASQRAPGLEQSLRARVERALAVLKDLGGLADLKEEDGQFVICGYSCPLAAVVERHPEVCQLAEVLLSEIVGETVDEHCDRTGPPRCVFTVAVS